MQTVDTILSTEWANKEIVMIVQSIVWYYSLQYNHFRAFWGICAANFGIYPIGRGLNLDLILCSVPTIGLYVKLGKEAVTSHFTPQAHR